MRSLINLIIVVLLSACASTSSDSGNEEQFADYGKCGVLNGSFVGEWFDYYKRALTYMDCEKWPEAEADLKQALQVRDIDKRRVYTSGMHLLKNYFPNRELGITLLRQGRAEQALKYFEKSYKQFPTAKNRYFWIEALRSQSSIFNDVNAPQIQLQKNTDSAWELSISDATYIDFIEVAGQRFPLLASRVVDDESVGYIPLEPEQQITVDKSALAGTGVDIVAVDVFGQKRVFNTEADVDKVAPHIKIRGGALNGQTLSATIEVFDESGIASITWGNTQMVAEELALLPTSQLNSSEDWVLKSELSITTTSPGTDVIVTDNLGNKRLYKLTENKIFNNSGISVYYSDMPSVTQDAYVLFEAEVTAGNSIQTLKLNNQTIPTTGEITSTLSQLVPLSLGSNIIALTVKDGTGQQHTETVTVQRKLPPEFKLDERLRLALLPFDCSKQVSSVCLSSNKGFKYLYDAFEDRGRFQLTSRNLLEKALIESPYCDFALSSDCLSYLADKFGIDEAQQIRLTQQSINEGSTAQALLVVDIDRRPMPSKQLDSVDIAIKVIQANSGEMLITFSNYEELPEGEITNIEAIASKIHSFFPVFQLPVLQGRQVKVETFSLWKNMPLIGKDDSVCYLGKVESSSSNQGWQYSTPRMTCDIKQLMTL